MRLGIAFAALATGVSLIAAGSSAAVAQGQQSDTTTSVETRKKCTPGYKPCLPPASDYDCYGGSGNGPAYTGRVKVKGYDPYRLDYDRDGIGCETVSFWGPVR
jgi:hypothetical protein